jgi:hypothetical protein
VADYKITIDLKNVGEGDGEFLADAIWNNESGGSGVNPGSFHISVSKDGVDVDWNPSTNKAVDI